MRLYLDKTDERKNKQREKGKKKKKNVTDLTSEAPVKENPVVRVSLDFVLCKKETITWLVLIAVLVSLMEYM